ncbi:MAG: rhodanese-like domain-containing protein [Desulfofustis sp.]|jgi:thiosulfate/3-mercaptopyruvate sulfurtransferase|nr:rhodanese-like domain-containing protein [Desulfofustis sp.]
MGTSFHVRFLFIALGLLVGVYWSFSSVEAESAASTYPNHQFLVTATQLQERMKSEPLVIVDVRTDEYYDGKMIPGAIRMPWTLFRRDNSAINMGGRFVGCVEAQKILGRHGIFRNDTIILYDSVARDGGATASYVFWVLDMLGHEQKAILERGIDAWRDSDGEIANGPVEREPLLYQAPADEIDIRRLTDEAFIYSRLGDPYYQVLDVRSPAEYRGESLNTGLDGSPLKAGHIPGAYNIDYETNWIDNKTLAIKDYTALAEMYRGLDPGKAVIVYCHSARRSSFSYFILRLMGFEDVIVYENSWYGWGSPERYYPVETQPHELPGQSLPKITKTAGSTGSTDTGSSSPEPKNAAEKESAAPAKKDYISCGG